MLETIVVVVFVGFGIALEVLLFAVLQPRRSCAECNAALPKFRRPRSWRQMMRGGTTCLCGAELDRRGKVRWGGAGGTGRAGG